MPDYRWARRPLDAWRRRVEPQPFTDAT